MTTTDETIPMPSTRVGDGVYEVLGTSRNCVVERELDGSLRPTGWWHLIVDGEWAQSYPTKREALQACQRDPSL